MSYVAAAIAGTSLVGAYVQSRAADDAASAQTNAANNARDVQLQMYNQSRADNEPWRKAGTEALGSLTKNDFMNNWQTDPGYQFRMDEGNKAINAAAGARGMYNSGATMKALAKYGQDYASGEYNNVYQRQYNRLSSLAGIGQNATGQNQASGQNYANQSSQAYQYLGNAQAANSVAQGNAFNGALSNGTNSWMQYQMMNRMFPKNAAATGSAGGYGSAGQSYFGSGTTA